MGAAIAEYVSTIGADRYIYDDFGPIVIGMLILSLAPFCSWVSLLLAGVLSAAVLSILIVGSSTSAVIAAPISALVAVNSAAVLAMSAAAAGYSYAIVDETLAWQREANRAALHRDAELRAGIARSVQQSRVSVLGREVLPFLAGVMTADRISVADADRARELAEALRRALKAGIESTWLDDLAANVQQSPWHPGGRRRPGRRRGRPRRRPAIRPHRPHLLAGRGEPFRRDPRDDHHRTATPSHRRRRRARGVAAVAPRSRPLRRGGSRRLHARGIDP